MEQFNSIKKIDLGCGPKKKQGTLGIDHFPYPGVDVVFDLNRVPWPLNDNQFETVYASHVIEHINFIPQFMQEIHRISKHQADVHIITPHFSSLDSWKDPTHRWHLSMEWYAVFCNPDKYLSDQMPGFKIISSDVNFSSSLRNIYPKFICRLFGLKTWEKHYSFRYPAKNIHTTLRVVKIITDET